MRTSRFVIQQAEGTTCPKCRKTLDMVAVRYASNLNLSDRNPSFYVCWTCHTLAQVGVGPVEPSHD